MQHLGQHLTLSIALELRPLPNAGDETRLMADILELQAVKRLRDLIINLGNSELRRVWEECEKSLPTGARYEHSHIKNLVEGLLARLTDETANRLSTPKRVREDVLLKVKEALKFIAANDANYPTPEP